MHDNPFGIRRAALLALALALVAGGCASPPAEDGADAAAADADGDADGDSDSDVIVGCDEGSGDGAHPFGAHEHPLADGAILPDAWTQAELDDRVCSFYTNWKSHHLETGCGDGRYYVATGFSSSLTVSEAHGYGMIIAAYMAGFDPNARDIFDGMYRYFADHPSAIDGDLMAWSQDYSCDSNQGATSATDGDLDVAFALLLADKQWGSTGAINYRAEAVRVIDAVLDSEVDGSGSYLLLGDWASPDEGAYYDATRSSDFMPGHLTAFDEARPSDGWITLRDRAYDMFRTLQEDYAAATGLLPDFVRYPADGPTPAGAGFLEGDYDGEYSYNACRVPWRVGTHFVTSGDADAAAVVGALNSWIQDATGGDPEEIRAGYWLDGDGLPGSNYTAMAFVAPFGVAAMVDADSQQWLNDLWAEIVSTAIEDSYFDDTLKLLSLIVMSGNWWAPETVECPEG